uniref:Synaptopodin 2-like b n=1 Tax=Denticeps clupeoides TaxID=299321 RepID=A0AAY4C6H1_9TELE
MAETAVICNIPRGGAKYQTLSESIQEKQVKEARSKCRTIASLLTDSPNPNSKGVLMFKKRRQRAKKYTLTCFGSVNGETCSRGDTEDEEDESFFLGSESEMDEETIAASNGLDPTWDSGYLDILDMKSSACRMDSDRKEDPDGHVGLSRSSGKGAQLFQLQKKRSEEHLAPPAANCVPRHVVPQQRAELTVSTPGPPAVQPPTGMVNGTPSADTSAGNAVLNRTAKPFAPGCVTHRSATAPVVFHPNTGTRAVSVANMPAAFAASPGPAVKRAISSASLYIPARPATVSGPPTHRVSFNPYVTVATTVPAQAHQQNGLPSEGLASREQRIAVPASRTGILQEAWRRPSKKPMFSQAEEKTNSPNPELLSLVQNLDERRKAGPDPGFESGPEEDFLNLGAEACNFMQAQRNKKIPPPPVAPKPAHHAPQITPQFGGKGAELFARRQSRMDRYVVDKQQPSAMPKATPQPRPPSPTPSLPVQWKYSPNIRAPPPISYNPLLSPSCPPGAQRATKSVEVTKAKQHHASPHRPGTNWMNQQPYQLSPSLFSYGGGVPPVTSTNQPQPASAMPVKSVRVQEIKRFSTPTPMSTSLKPTVLVPRSATTLGVPRPRFSTSTAGLQANVWRPGSILY